MRLTSAQVNHITSALDPFLKDHAAEIRLYGSRLDDHKKGGDIDLLLIAHSAAMQNHYLSEKHRLLASIKKHLGDQKIDLAIVNQDQLTSDPFFSLVYPTSILLKRWK